MTGAYRITSHIFVIWDDNEVGRRYGGSYSTGCMMIAYSIFSDLPFEQESADRVEF